MPTLPTYEAKRNIVQPKVSSQPAVQEQQGAGEAYEGTQNILKGAEEVIGAWQKVQDTMDYTKAKANYGIEIAKVKAAFEVEPDYKNLPAYQKQMQDITKGFNDTFHNKELAQRALLEAQTDITIANLELGATARKKELRDYALNLKVANDVAINDIVNAPTPLYAQQKMAAAVAAIDNGFKTGAITVEQADKLKDDLRLKPAELAIYKDPEQGKRDIEAGKFDLDDKEKTGLIIKANKLEKSKSDFEDWQIKQTRIESAFKLSDALANGTLTPTMVRELQQSGRIDSETAAIFDGVALNKSYTVPAATSLGEPEYFLRLIEDSLNNKSNIEKVLKDAATAYGKGKIGSNQYLYFVQKTKEIFDNQLKGVQGASQKQETAKYAVNGIKSFVKSLVDPTEFGKVAANLLGKYIDRIQQGEEPMKAKNDVIQERLNYDIGEAKKTTPEQAVRMLAPDGKFYMVQPKNIDKALNKGFKRAK